jgi:ATP-binding cassette subfamily B protein
MDFPNKFETILGERGVNLSGGQKQRISIARALLRKPQLLLLDDCLSAVDTETEDVILNNIHRNHKERTTIVVSHRISTIRNANDILVLDQGRVIEQGSHEELLIKNASYAEMHRKQLEKK